MTDPDVFLDLADLFPEPHLLLTVDGRILAANQALRRFYGTDDEPQGTALESMLASPPDELHEYLARCAGSRSMVPGVLELRDAGGETRAFRADGCVARPADAGVEPWVLLRLRDRRTAGESFAQLNTQLRELQTELGRRERREAERTRLLAEAHEARVSAEEAARLRDEFLSSLSHELRTPVNAILGWATLLGDAEVKNLSMERALESIVRNAREQARMVDDLLDLSRMTTGRLDLQIEPVDMVDVVREAVEAVMPAARAKRITVDVVARGDDGVSASGDRRRLGQVAWNLLSNAVKFTSAGGRVVVTVGRSDGEVELVVEDTGAGIPPDVLPFIFDRFRQGDQSMTRRHGGLGLGLAIVRHLVELHGGTVDVHSAGKGRGSRFRVHLPAGETNGVEAHAST